MPVVWPIAAQTFRVAVELFLFAYVRVGRAPTQISFEGRNFDIVVGLTAPLVAWLVVSGRASRAVVVGWNVLGLLILASTVATIVSSVPGPLHHDWPGAPLTEIATFPVIWLAAFLMPLAVFFHVVSIRRAGHDPR